MVDSGVVQGTLLQIFAAGICTDTIVLWEANLLSDTGHPSRVLGTRSILEDVIHLFQCLALRLWDKQPDPEEHEHTAACEKDVGSVLDVSQHRRGSSTDDKVHQPIDRGCDRHGLGTSGHWEDFGWKNPTDWSPGVGKVGDEEVNESNSSPTSSWVCVEPAIICGGEGSDDSVGDSHTNGTSHEKLLASKPVKEHDSWQCEDNVDDTNDTSCEKRGGISVKTESREDRWGVVDDGVDTSELLTDLHETSNENSLCKWTNGNEGLVLSQGQLESAHPRVLLSSRHFIEADGSKDLLEFKLDIFVVLWEAAELCDNSKSLFVPSLLCQPTGRKWKEPL